MCEQNVLLCKKGNWITYAFFLQISEIFEVLILQDIPRNLDFVKYQKKIHRNKKYIQKICANFFLALRMYLLKNFVYHVPWTLEIWSFKLLLLSNDLFVKGIQPKVTLNSTELLHTNIWHVLSKKNFLRHDLIWLLCNSNFKKSCKFLYSFCSKC